MTLKLLCNENYRIGIKYKNEMHFMYTSLGYCSYFSEILENTRGWYDGDIIEKYIETNTFFLLYLFGLKIVLLWIHVTKIRLLSDTYFFDAEQL